MARWAQSAGDRNQIVLFAPTLDSSVPVDHPVRLFDELLGALDFSDWEARYVLNDGQPPIHPRTMAGVLLYGWTLGIRSSRKLEDSTGNRIDFLWLTSGRVIDHSTLAGFRVRFEAELKGLFKQVGRVAIDLGMANLNRVALDGTVKRSNNARSAVGKQASLEQKLAALDQQVEALMRQATEADGQEDQLFGESSPSQLPRQLKDLKARQERLAAALKKVRQTDARQQAKGRGKKDGPAVPLSDPDSSLMKNKTGGFAPNHLLILAAESKNGLIVDCDVATDSDEPSSVMPVMQRIQQNFGDCATDNASVEDATKKDAARENATEQGAAGPAAGGHVVRQLLADANFNTGTNLRQLTDAGIEPFMPGKQPAPTSDASPARTPDGSSRPKSLDKSLFVFNSQSDQYQCPSGRPLPFARCGTDQRKEGPLHFRTYQSIDCGNCALSKQCLSDNAKTRSIRRDEHEPLREQMAARMSSDAGKTIYRRRSHIAETPFAVMNTTMNFRQHLLRGLRKTRIELFWFATACNLKKLMNLLTIANAAAAA